jgi:hypothetical protein
MTTELQVAQPGGGAVTLSADQIKAQVGLIQRVMKAVMKKDTHYGVIPGTQKPTLYKAGSEVLLTTFRIAVELDVDDLSTSDEVRYRVRVTGRHQGSGIVVGMGIGECSSSEEKYRWRNVVCQQEYDEAFEDRRRMKWQRGRDAPYSRAQVRTVPADVANTVLKMAKKRAQIDMTLTALAASDIFTQDVEDMPEEIRESSGESENPAPAAAGKPATQPPQATPHGNGGKTGVATDKQQKLVRSRLDHSGIPENEFLKAMEIDSVSALPFAKVDLALSWIQQHGP